MRRIVYSIICVLIFFAACTPQTIDYSQFEVVELYTSMSAGDVQIKDTLWEGEKASDIKDLVAQECPEELQGSFRRVVITGTGSQLILYTDSSGDELLCSLYKPDATDIQNLASSEAPGENILLTVNGINVLASAVQQELNSLPANVPRDETAIGQAINRAINNELLRQESLDITPSEEEIAAARESLLANLGLTEEALQSQISDGTIEEDVFVQIVMEQARLSVLLRERLVLGNINVSEDDLRQVYLNNPNQFLQSESAVMRQIVVASENRTIEQLESRVQSIANFLQTGDFCEGVRRFSDMDQGKDQCGAFVVPRGVLNPDLEYAAFNTQVNQTSVVQTATGVHFVQTLQVVPAQVVPYSQAAGQLRDTVVNSVFQQRLNLYLSMLRGDATIVTYIN